jgi:hypothetical protein
MTTDDRPTPQQAAARYTEVMERQCPNMTAGMRAQVERIQAMFNDWADELSPDEFWEQLNLFAATARTIAERCDAGKTPAESGMSPEYTMEVYDRLERFRTRRVTP